MKPEREKNGANPNLEDMAPDGMGMVGRRGRVPPADHRVEHGDGAPQPLWRTLCARQLRLHLPAHRLFFRAARALLGLFVDTVSAKTPYHPMAALDAGLCRHGFPLRTDGPAQQQRRLYAASLDLPTLRRVSSDIRAYYLVKIEIGGHVLPQHFNQSSLKKDIFQAA